MWPFNTVVWVFTKAPGWFADVFFGIYCRMFSMLFFSKFKGFCPADRWEAIQQESGLDWIKNNVLVLLVYIPTGLLPNPWYLFYFTDIGRDSGTFRSRMISSQFLHILFTWAPLL